MPDFPWPTLIKKIKNGYCTPFIGAGTSFPSVPIAADLADRLLKEYPKQKDAELCPLPDQSDLAKVTQFLAIKAQDPLAAKLDIAEAIRKCDTPDERDENEPHRVLAELPLPLYITTNYDDFMYSALQAAQKRRPEKRTSAILSVHRDYCRWTDKLLQENRSIFDDRTFAPDAARPVVFHLHGHINREGDPKNRGAVEGIVATEDDYLDFLVNVSNSLGNGSAVRATKKMMLPLAIQTALRGTTLLFIGYSMTDVNFRVILRALRRSLQNANEPLSIAIQYAGSNPKELRDYLEEYFRRVLTLNLYWDTAHDFTTELRAQWLAS